MTILVSKSQHVLNERTALSNYMNSVATLSYFIYIQGLKSTYLDNSYTVRIYLLTLNID